MSGASVRDFSQYLMQALVLRHSLFLGLAFLAVATIPSQKPGLALKRRMFPTLFPSCEAAPSNARGLSSRKKEDRPGSHKAFSRKLLGFVAPQTRPVFTVRLL
jgi:hypothetical protein